MKRIILAGVTAVLLATPVVAQTSTTVTTTAPSSSTVTIAPAERTRIKTYVTEHKVRPVTVKERLAVGATVPSDVELEAVPSEWGADVSRYRYFYSGNDVMLVDPATRHVVQVID